MREWKDPENIYIWEAEMSFKNATFQRWSWSLFCLNAYSRCDRGRRTAASHCILYVHREHFVFFRSSGGRTLPLCSLTAHYHRLPPSLVIVSLLCVLLYGRASPCLMVKIEFPTWAAQCIMCVSVSLLCKLGYACRCWVSYEEMDHLCSNFTVEKFKLQSKWDWDRWFGA